MQPSSNQRPRFHVKLLLIDGSLTTFIDSGDTSNIIDEGPPCQLGLSRVPLSPGPSQSPGRSSSGDRHPSDYSGSHALVRQPSRDHPVPYPAVTSHSYDPRVPLALTSQPAHRLDDWCHPRTECFLSPGLPPSSPATWGSQKPLMSFSSGSGGPTLKKRHGSCQCLPGPQLAEAITPGSRWLPAAPPCATSHLVSHLSGPSPI